MRGSTLHDYEVVNNQSGFLSLLQIPDCGTYTAHLWAREVEPGCNNTYQLLMSDTKHYPLCW